MAKSDTFGEFVEKERTRLNDARKDALSRRAAIDDEVTAIDRELTAIAAYEAAKTGKKTTGTRTPRATGRRDELLSVIGSARGGLTRGEILEKMGLKGNKSGEQSVSNALNSLKKQGKLSQQDGRYMAA